jgi:hypothetical protein
MFVITVCLHYKFKKSPPPPPPKKKAKKICPNILIATQSEMIDVTQSGKLKHNHYGIWIGHTNAKHSQLQRYKLNLNISNSNHSKQFQSLIVQCNKTLAPSTLAVKTMNPGTPVPNLCWIPTCHIARGYIQTAKIFNYRENIAKSFTNLTRIFFPALAQSSRSKFVLLHQQIFST